MRTIPMPFVYPQTYPKQHFSFEQLNGPNSNRRFKPKDRVWVYALKKPAIVLYCLNDSFVQIDTGNGPVLLNEEDIVAMPLAVKMRLTEHSHDYFFNKILPEFQDRFMNALPDANKKAYTHYISETQKKD